MGTHDKKKSTGKRNGSAGKVVSNNPSWKKQGIVVLISLIVLVALIAVLYPMVKEKGVTGKAVGDISMPGCKSSPGVGEYPFGYVALFYNQPPPVLCVEESKGVSCDATTLGLIQNINEQFDVLCKNGQDGSLQWAECNADGVQGGSGAISSHSEEVWQNKYLCAQNNQYESWQVCTKDQTSPPNGNGVYVSKGTISGSKSQFLCRSSSSETKWETCLPGIVESLSGAGDETLKYSCWDEKWHDCSLQENNGVVGKNGINFCDGAKWVKCDS